MNEVWVVCQSYNNWKPPLLGAYSSLERAIERLKESYLSPCIVSWHEPVEVGNSIIINADFDYVPLHMVRHSKQFTITKWVIDDGEEPQESQVNVKKICDLCENNNNAYQLRSGKWCHAIRASAAELNMGFLDYEVSCLAKNDL